MAGGQHIGMSRGTPRGLEGDPIHDPSLLIPRQGGGIEMEKVTKPVENKRPADPQVKKRPITKG